MPTELLRAQLLKAYEQDRPALTVELARLYLATESDDRSALLIYGETLTDLGRYPEACAALERALELSSPTEPARRASALRLLGRLHDVRGAYPEAERHYREAIDAAPDHASAYIYLGSLHARAGRLAEAEKLHRQAAECGEGEVSEALLNLGLVRRARGDYVGALENLRSALDVDPADAAVRAALLDVEAVLFEFPAPEA